MKNRFTPLVEIKKNQLKKSEEVVTRANIMLQDALYTLDESYVKIDSIATPTSGYVQDFLSKRALLDIQRDVINYNKERVEFCKNQLQDAKLQLKKDNMEFEKFKYLELQEIKKEQQKLKLQESKRLDEVAIMRYKGKVDE